MPVRDIIEGRPVLLVIDIQNSDFLDDRSGVADGIPVREGYRDRVIRTRELVDVAHETGVPIVFFKEIHRPDHVDFGRELDGSEGVHCIETSPLTQVAEADPQIRKIVEESGPAQAQCVYGCLDSEAPGRTHEPGMAHDVVCLGRYLHTRVQVKGHV